MIWIFLRTTADEMGEKRLNLRLLFDAKSKWLKSWKRKNRKILTNSWPLTRKIAMLSLNCEFSSNWSRKWWMNFWTRFESLLKIPKNWVSKVELLRSWSQFILKKRGINSKKLKKVKKDFFTSSLLTVGDLTLHPQISALLMSKNAWMRWKLKEKNLISLKQIWEQLLKLKWQASSWKRSSLKNSDRWLLENLVHMQLQSSAHLIKVLIEIKAYHQQIR